MGSDTHGPSYARGGLRWSETTCPAVLQTIDSMVTGDWDPKAPNSRARQAQDMMRNAASSFLVPGDVLESSGAYCFVVDLPVAKKDIKARMLRTYDIQAV